MALRKLGYSGNTTDPKEIEAAYNELKKLMPNVAAFNSDNPANPYMEGEVNLGMIWNVLLSLHARRVRQLMWCGRKKAVFSGWTAWRSRQMPKTKKAH